MFFAYYYDLILVDVILLNINEINSGVLAYLGDSVYELEIRSYLISKTHVKPNELQRLAINYVSAESQAKILDNLLAKNILTEEEISTIKRARNYSPNSKPKHTDIKTYKKATALEALFGVLYINEEKIRIKELTKEIVGE